MLRLLKWLLAAFASMVISALAFLPAAWIAPLIERQTGGRIVIGDAQGTVWRGSAVVGAAYGRDEPAAQLVPGRFSWELSPMILLGQVNARLRNPLALSQPVQISGSVRQWQISPAAINMPAERLAALGAPLNTVQPSGQMRLSWDLLQLALRNGAVSINGPMVIEMHNIASRLSPIRPLGAYRMVLNWRGNQAQANLETLQGPLLLSGSGMIANGRLRFFGKAEAQAGYEERLANLLNLLGQRRREGGKDVIALEFK